MNTRRFDDFETLVSDLQIFLNPFLSGSLLMPFSLSLALQIFVLFFSFLIFGCFSLVCSSVLRLQPLHFQKKKGSYKGDKAWQM